MTTLIHEQGFSRRNAVNVDSVILQVVWKRLLHIQNHAVYARMLNNKLVKDFVNVTGIGNRAIEVASQPVGTFFNGDVADVYQSLIIPFSAIASKFDLQAL